MFSRYRNTVSFNIEWAMVMYDTLVNLCKLHDVLINTDKLLENIKSECMFETIFCLLLFQC